MIELLKVSKVFNAGRPNGVVALRDIDLSINGEGTIVFRGPSGSGKTTLLSVVGAMARPTTGRIWINDRDISGLPERFLAELRRSHFGFLFQDFHLIHGLSSLQNVMLPLYPTPESGRKLRARAEGLLQDLEMDAKAAEPIEHLSGGEQQRVALARALINDPQFLVADEPTAHLDTRLSNRFMDVVERLRKEGKTVLMASHDPLVCESLITRRVITLRDGRLQPTEADL